MDKLIAWIWRLRWWWLDRKKVKSVMVPRFVSSEKCWDRYFKNDGEHIRQ